MVVLARQAQRATSAPRLSRTPAPLSNRGQCEPGNLLSSSEPLDMTAFSLCVLTFHPNCALGHRTFRAPQFSILLNSLLSTQSLHLPPYTPSRRAGHSPRAALEISAGVSPISLWEADDQPQWSAAASGPSLDHTFTCITQCCHKLWCFDYQ